MISLPVPEDPALIVIQDISAPMSVTVGTNDVHFGGGSSGTANAGSYTVEVRAWADNDVDTEEFELL